MSDPKRAAFITVVDTKSAKNKVTKTVRLTINLDESNESKYPELNYKELLKAAVAKQNNENCKTPGPNPFSDNEDELAMQAHRFEQKYGGKSTYGRSRKGKRDDFADIGAGYDENDSFIDNTDGYDELVPPDCDTYYGGFYINCGSLEFKPVRDDRDDRDAMSDGDQPGRGNKRAISPSSSEAVPTDSSSDSDSGDGEDDKECDGDGDGEAKRPPLANGAVDSLSGEHRKKKNKKIDKKKPKKIRRTDSSAAASGKQTSDDNAAAGDAGEAGEAGEGGEPGEAGESADSRTSQSDSLTSKPARGSETAATSDSSREAEPGALPPAVQRVLEELRAAVGRAPPPPSAAAHHPHVLRLDRVLSRCCPDGRAQRAAWARAARTLRTSRHRLLAIVRAWTDPPSTSTVSSSQSTTPTVTSAPATTAVISSTVTSSTSQPASSTGQPANKRKRPEALEDLDVEQMTPEEKEAKIVETLQLLRLLIEERKPDMIATYNNECKRVQEERKKQQQSGTGPHIEKRLPKRRFPWCGASRALLARLARLAGARDAAATLLAVRALPLFPSGFVRMPTLLRQANLSKEIKASDMKRPRINPVSHPTGIPIQPSFSEPIQFPSSLTVTTTMKATDKNDVDESKYKLNPEAVFGSILNTYSLSKDSDKTEERKKEITDKSKEEVYIPPNIGSITITPVLSSQKTDRKVNNSSVASEKPKESMIRIKSPAALNNSALPLEKPKESLIRVKSPAALNEMAKKNEKEKLKKLEKINAVKEKRVTSPLHIDTSYQSNKKELSPKMRIEEINPKQIEAMRLAENNIPRPALIAVHNSPTFAKPDKRPPEVKKKKEIVIVSDLDPLGDNQPDAVAVDDSSSDVEVIEDKDISECASDSRNDIVPSKDKVSDGLKADSISRSLSLIKDRECQKKGEQLDEETKELFDIVKANLSELEHSQEPAKSNSYGDSVINSAQNELL